MLSRCLIRSFSRSAAASGEAVDALVIGAGPAGMTAAASLGKAGATTLVAEKAPIVGGSLHQWSFKLFGTKEDTYGAARGKTAAQNLEKEMKKHDKVKVLVDSEVSVAGQGTFKVGDLEVNPKHVVLAAGTVFPKGTFPGADLDGVIGADEVPGRADDVESAVVVGAGNAGLSAAYAILRAGKKVAGIVTKEAAAEGYSVLSHYLERVGVPFFFNAEIESAVGDGKLTGVKVAGKELTADTLIISSGRKVPEELVKAMEGAGVPVHVAGDIKEAGEVWAAMMEGKVVGNKVAKELGLPTEDLTELEDKASLMKFSKGAVSKQERIEIEEGIVPVLFCDTEIPCNICVTACNQDNLKIDNFTGKPTFVGQAEDCDGCTRCVSRCPGLAITLLDFADEENIMVTFPYELDKDKADVGEMVRVVSVEGEDLGEFEVQDVDEDGDTMMVTLELPRDIVHTAAAIKVEM